MGALILRWCGNYQPFLDTPTVRACGHIVVGRFGGATRSGAAKNEDGALACCDPDGHWELAAILDGHASSESVTLVLDTLTDALPSLAASLEQPVERALPDVQRRVLAALSSPEFQDRCRHVQGETACLVVVRTEQFLWWLCIGDCVTYLFHPELAALGQYALNQRSFYEWVGRANALALPVPCYASGTRELRSGRNVILLCTDGLLECGRRPFEDARALADLFMPQPDRSIDQSVQAALARVQAEGGRDSATLIAWSMDNPWPAMRPSG